MFHKLVRIIFSNFIIKLFHKLNFRYYSFIVPGAPRNVTYRIVGCEQSTEFCHLNVSWLHPYNQNGTITAFNIILNSTDEHRDINDTKYIQDVYKIENNTYYSYYTYQVKFISLNYYQII